MGKRLTSYVAVLSKLTDGYVMSHKHYVHCDSTATARRVLDLELAREFGTRQVQEAREIARSQPGMPHTICGIYPNTVRIVDYDYGNPEEIGGAIFLYGQVLPAGAVKPGRRAEQCLTEAHVNAQTLTAFPYLHPAVVTCNTDETYYNPMYYRWQDGVKAVAIEAREQITA